MSPKKIFLTWLGSILFSIGFILSGPFFYVLVQRVSLIQSLMMAALGTALTYFLSPMIGFMYLSIFLAVFIFYNLRPTQKDIFSMGLLAATVGALPVYLLGLYFYFSGHLGVDWAVTALKNNLTELHEKGLFTPEQMELIVSSDVLRLTVLNVPSYVLMAFLCSLFLAISFEKIILKFLDTTPITQFQLGKFSVPEVLIWPLIASLAFGFLGSTPNMAKIVALNLFNILLLCYSFQGFAVLIEFFRIFNVGAFTRYLVIFLLVFDLWLAMGCVGVIDYWVDFRKRFKDRASKMKKRRES